MTAIKRCFILASILAVIIFASSMSNAQEVAYSFDKNDGNGSRPGGKLVRVNGYLYGLANDGGDFGKGVLFRVKPDGSDYEVIHHFQVATGSLAVSGGLVTHGEWLYGETTHGGLHDSGVLFKVRLDGSEYTVLHDFGLAGEPSGISSRPYLLGEYLFCLEGNIGAGQFFRVNVNTGVLTTLHNFNTGIDSSHHFNADLTYDGQRFYSTSERGGQFSAGTIFSILPDGSGYNQLYSFDPTKEDGCEPSGAALLLKGEHLYGITPVGIDSDWGRPKAVGGAANGVIFRIKKDGSDYKALHKFVNLPGLLKANRYDEGLVWANGKMYGFVSAGGSYGRGAAFCLDGNGENFAILAEFNVKSGSPFSPPLLIGSNIYGLSSHGGSKSAGSLFAVLSNPSNSRINVSIVPQDAGRQGARWSFAYQNSWRKAGATGLKAGKYTIVFKEVPGWQKPDDIEISVKNGQTLNVQGKYVSNVPQGQGYVSVFIKNLSARKAGARWTVVGADKWLKSGEMVKVPVGKVKIKFRTVKGFKKPGRKVIKVSGGITEQLFEKYTQK